MKDKKSDIAHYAKIKAADLQKDYDDLLKIEWAFGDGFDTDIIDYR